MIGGTSGSGPELSSPPAVDISNSRLSNHSNRLLVSSGDCLQEWLERFADRLKGRINTVADDVQQVMDQMAAVELNLQNTFNSFRCLSSSQFIENRVYEEDETEGANLGTPRRDSRQPLMPTESYEDEILPRYKEAVGIAWAAYQRSNRQNDQSSVRPKARSKLRDSHRNEMFQLLPHIIGTEDFARDVNCGLADLRQKHRVTDDTEFDIDDERDGAHLVAELIGSGIPSEREASGIESDASDFEEGGLEPAVSAALDFKAMLEAALRNPSLPYDGTLNDSDNVFGEFGDNKFSLPNLANDTLSDTPRTISTMVDIIGRTMSTMDKKDELHSNTSEVSKATVDSTQLPPASRQQSTSEKNATPFTSLQPYEGDLTYPSTIEKLLKQHFNSQTEAMLNQEYRQENNGSGQQVRTRGLGQAPNIPETLFDDEESDTGLMTRESGFLPNSNTGPTVPEALFQKQPSLDVPQHTRSESQSSNSIDSSQVVVNSEHSLVNVVAGASDQDLGHVVTDLDRKGSDKSQLTISPPVTKHASPQSASSSISSGSNVITGSQHSGPLPIRGGLFDDDDDEDEGPGDLFGASAPRVESQPSLRPWASHSSSSLFDDIKTINTEQDANPWISDETQYSQEGQRNNDISSFPTSQYGSQSSQGALDSQRQPVDNVSPKPSLGTTHLDLVTPTDLKEVKFDSPSDGGEENMQSPIQSKLAAAIRSSAPSGVDSDEESWSSSGSEDDSVTQAKGDTEQPISQDRAPLDILETDNRGTNAPEGRKAESIFDLKPAEPVVESGHLARSPTSTERTSQAAIHGEEGEDSVSSSQLTHEVPPVRLPPAMSRSFSVTEASPIKVAIKLADSPLLQSKRVELSDADESDAGSDSSTSSSQHMAQPQPVQTTFSRTLGPSEEQASSSSQPTSFLMDAPTFSSQNSVETNKLTLGDVRKTSSTGPPLPVNVFDRLTSRRTFTLLFEDDDAEEDLFGQNMSSKQGGLFPGAGQHETGLASNTTFAASLGGQDMVLTSEAPLLTQDVTPQLRQVSNSSPDSSSTSLPKRVEKEGNISSTKSSSKLSSLLFGDDDEDSENALFGPLGGRTSRRQSNGSKSEKAVSLFGDTNLPSTLSNPSPTQSRSLFDD